MSNKISASVKTVNISAKFSKTKVCALEIWLSTIVTVYIISSLLICLLLKDHIDGQQLKFSSERSVILSKFLEASYQYSSAYFFHH